MSKEMYEELRKRCAKTKVEISGIMSAERQGEDINIKEIWTDINCIKSNSKKEINYDTDIYIDKSGLIELINQSIETPRRLTCISRPRRFGKSFAAQMLCAYYDRSCDSSGLFGDLAISRTADYRTHLNHYDVIYLNMTDVLGETSADDFVAFIRRNIVRELVDAYPSMHVLEHFGATLASAVQASGSRFIMKIPLIHI